MTPLVDVAFLLLTFFMFATTMAQPHVMEMTAPPELYYPLSQPSYLKIYLRKDGVLFWRKGDESSLQRLERRALRALAVEHYGNGENAIALRIDTVARYGAMIDLIDELHHGERIANEREGDPNHEWVEGFSVERMTPAEQKEVGML